MSFVSLTAINIREEQKRKVKAAVAANDTRNEALAEAGSNVVQLDDLEREVIDPDVAEEIRKLPDGDLTHKITINVSQIREFYPRKGGEGTRIVFPNGAAQLVSESYEDVRLALNIFT